MPYCADTNLTNLIFSNSTNIEKNCIYVLRTPLQVIQVIEGGILVTLNHSSAYIGHKVFFLKTKKQYVDGDFVVDILIHLIGTKKYLSTLGSQKTVHAFEQLGE